MKKTIIACLSGTLATLGAIDHAIAQSATETGLELEEVVVTAEKRETNLQKTAQSIQVLSGEQLKKEAKSRVDEILNGVAGLNLQSSQVGSTVYIRGNAQGVAVVVDGAVNMRPETIRGGTLDVSQVEVMRGTQSATTIGGNVLAGAVSLVSNQPVFEYQTSGSLEAGSYNTRNAEGVLNLPITNDQAIRASFSTNKRDGYISANAGDSDQFQGRIKYRWKPSDALDIVATVNTQNIGGNGVSDGTLLYTGQWQSWTALTGSSSSFNWTNPITGVTSTYNAYGANASSVFRSPVNSQGQYSGTTLTANPATIYSPCYTGGTSSLVSANSNTTPLIYVMGCPAMYVAVRNGVTYDQRSNPWDDGYPADVWPNNPYRHTNINTYQVEANWDTSIGKFTAVPSIQRTTFNSQEVQRGTSYMGESRRQGYEQLDLRLASHDDGKLIWLAGLNYNHTGAAVGYQRTTYLPITAYPTVTSGSSTTNLIGCYLADSPFLCYDQSNTLGGGTTDLAAYSNGTLRLLSDNQLRLTAGLRYNYSTVEYDSTNQLMTDSDGNNAYVDTVSNTGGVYSITRVPTAFTEVEGKKKYVHTVWNAGIEYDVLPEAMVYANYSTGYQRGALTTSGMGVTATTLVAGPGLTLEQIALGIKSRWFDNKLQANVEAFDSRYHNRTFQSVGLGNSITYAVTPTDSNASTCSPTSSNPAVAAFNTTGTEASGCFGLSTAAYYADMRSSGVDLDMAFVPTSRDRIDLSLEFLRSTFTKATGVDNYTGDDILSLAGLSGSTDASLTSIASTLASEFNDFIGSVKGATLTQSPRWSGNLAYQHEFAFNNGVTVTPRAAMSYKSAYWISPTVATGNPITEAALAMDTGAYFPLVQRTYRLYDFFTTVASKDGKYQLSAYVRNIGNTPVMSNSSPSYTGTVAAGNIVVNGGYVDLLPPRTFGLTLSANY
ncbi:MAG: TonB-dependent receptor [Steroidobacteraceae bacterium]